MVRVVLAFIILASTAFGSYVIVPGTGSSTAVVDFTSSSGLTYSSSDVEFTSGVAKLVNQWGSDCVFGAKLSSSINADYSKLGGVLTGTAVGTAAIADGLLDLRDGASAKYVHWPSYKNVTLEPNGTIKLKYTPDYEGNPAERQGIFTVTSQSGSSDNSILFWHQSSALQMQLANINSSATLYMSRAWTPTSGVEYELELVYSFNGGNTRIFIDGVQQGAAGTFTNTRDNRLGILRVGVDNSTTPVADFKMRDLVWYDTQRHTAGYTPGYTLPATTYLTTSPTITQTTGTSMSSISAFSAGVTTSGSDAVKFCLDVDGTIKYWNGSAWTTTVTCSNSASSTAAQINSNAATLLSGTATVKVVTVLHSADGSTTPSVSWARITYR